MYAFLMQARLSFYPRVAAQLAGWPAKLVEIGADEPWAVPSEKLPNPSTSSSHACTLCRLDAS